MIRRSNRRFRAQTAKTAIGIIFMLSLMAAPLLAVVALNPVWATGYAGTVPLPISVANGGTALTALGSPLQVLRVNAGGTGLEYATLSSFSNPMTTTGDLIYSSDNSGTPARRGIGSANDLLTVSGGLPTWAAPSFAASAITSGQLSAARGGTGADLSGGSSGQIPRANGSGAFALSTATYPSTAGTSGNVLTSDGTNWTSSAPTGGMTNPMTTTGDIIYSSSGSTPARKAIGSNGSVLGVASGIPTYSGAGSSGQLYQSAGSSIGGWTTATYPTTGSTGDLMAVTGANAYGSISPVVEGSTLCATGTTTVPAYRPSIAPTQKDGAQTFSSNDSTTFTVGGQLKNYAGCTVNSGITVTIAHSGCRITTTKLTVTSTGAITCTPDVPGGGANPGDGSTDVYFPQGVGAATGSQQIQQFLTATAIGGAGGGCGGAGGNGSQAIGAIYKGGNAAVLSSGLTGSGGAGGSSDGAGATAGVGGAGGQRLTIVNGTSAIAGTGTINCKGGAGTAASGGGASTSAGGGGGGSGGVVAIYDSSGAATSALVVDVSGGAGGAGSGATLGAPGSGGGGGGFVMYMGTGTDNIAETLTGGAAGAKAGGGTVGTAGSSGQMVSINQYPSLPLTVLDHQSPTWQLIAWIDRCRDGSTDHKYDGDTYVKAVAAWYAAPGKFDQMCRALHEGCTVDQLAALMNPDDAQEMRQVAKQFENNAVIKEQWQAPSYQNCQLMQFNEKELLKNAS